MFPLNEARLIIVLISLLAFSPGTIFASRIPAAQAQQPTPQATPVVVQAPRGGEALQGVVSITGTTDLPGFRSMEVSFAYQNDSTGTWFLLQQSAQPVTEGRLASWDTTTITDGVYRLRIKVFFQDGRSQDFFMNGLRVRNYTPVETSTPDPGTDLGPAPQETPTPTSTPLGDFQITRRSPEPAPTNPVELTGWDLQASMLRGVVAIFGALLFAGAYLGLRFLQKR